MRDMDIPVSASCIILNMLAMISSVPLNNLYIILFFGSLAIISSIFLLVAICVVDLE